jgi:hypothetical protein
MTHPPSRQFETPEEFQAYLASSQPALDSGSDGTWVPTPRSPVEALGSIVTKVVPVVLVGAAFMVFHTSPGDSKPATHEDRVSAMSWLAWFAGRDFDANTCVLTKTVPMPELPKLDLSANQRMVDSIIEVNRRQTESIRSGVRSMPGR